MDDPTRRCENDGVKTTLTMERAFSGLPVPSGSPTFLPLTGVKTRLNSCLGCDPRICGWHAIIAIQGARNGLQ
jgi:hypothetical protein